MTLRRFLLLIGLCACTVHSWAFDTGRARTILETLAANAFQGRRPGFPGGAKTEQYLAENFRVCGVEPGGRAGFFQDVPMLVTSEDAAELTLMDHELGRIPFTMGVDFCPIVHSGAGTVIAPTVIAGFGYVRPDRNRDDYAGVDVKDKVVLIIRGIPHSPYDFSRDQERRQLLAWARERKAAAVLFYQQAPPVPGAAIPAELYDPNLPLLYVGDRLLALLLDGHGYSVETYLAALKESPRPIETGKRVYVNVRSRKMSSQSSRNVLGIVYGTDPVLRNEIVVAGAHWDHIGMDGRGVVYNGADDNASGTAIVAELARAFAAEPAKRSVMFMHFTGEENGLLGSDYFVNNPTVPFGNLAAMVNLDCEGLGSGTVVMAGGETLGPVWNEYVSTLDSSDLQTLIFTRQHGRAAGDYASFSRAGCPAVAFWSRGEHPFYHSYEDDARWISDSVLAAVGRRAEHFIRFLADREGSLAAHADSLTLLARRAITVDFGGFVVDAQGNVPKLSAVTAAWLPREAALTTEAIRRMSELLDVCQSRQITVAGPKDALTACTRHQPALFLGADDVDLANRRRADMGMLVRQGLSVIRLTPATADVRRNSAPDALEEARKAGLYALTPFDFSTASRVERWGERAIVRGVLTDFAAAPAAVREGLLSSDAMLVLEVTASATADQLETVQAGAARRVHLSFGSLPDYRREFEAKNVIRTLFEAGFGYDDILLLTGGNLRRYFGL